MYRWEPQYLFSAFHHAGLEDVRRAQTRVHPAIGPSRCTARARRGIRPEEIARSYVPQVPIQVVRNVGQVGLHHDEDPRIAKPL